MSALSNATVHMWLLSTCHVASATEEQAFLVYLILTELNLNLNSHTARDGLIVQHMSRILV